MKIVFLAAALAWESFAAVTYQRVPCVNMVAEYKAIWNRLANAEPALDSIVYGSVQRSGRPLVNPRVLPDGRLVYEVDATNCVVEFPVEGGVRVDGTRRVMFDYQWYAGGHRLVSHEGLRVEYRETPSFFIESVVSCRSPEACARLGIPFPSP